MWKESWLSTKVENGHLQEFPESDQPRKDKDLARPDGFCHRKIILLPSLKVEDGITIASIISQIVPPPLFALRHDFERYLVRIGFHS